LLVYRKGDGRVVVELDRWEARTFAYDLSDDAGLRLLRSIVGEVRRSLDEDEEDEE
jgi:hypothetical protein